MSRLFIVCLLVSPLLAGGPSVPAAAWDAGRPDSHAPIGVMGDHTHHAGEVMLGYRFMHMSMNGNLDGSHHVSHRKVLSQFPVSPTSMDVDMHMFELMAAPTDRLTLMAMIPVLDKSMDHVTRMGQRFTTRSSGLGDVSFSGLWRAWENERHRLQLQAGLGTPTGSIRAEDQTPQGRMRLPYPMQLGSGTFSLRPGLTYVGQGGSFSWGAQGTGTIQLGRNSLDYRVGNAYELTAWGAFRATSWLSTALRLDWQQWFDISGSDAALNPQMVPTADPDRRAGRRLDLLGSVNLLVPRGPLKGHRFALEVGFPVAQRLHGPQLEQDWTITVGWQYAFHAWR